MTGRYRTIMADPPWSFRDSLRMSDVKRWAGDHYQTMTVDQICALGRVGVPRTVAGFPVATNAFLFLWTTNAMLLDGSATRVCRAWGFEPRQLVTWAKGRVAGDRFTPQIGMGHFTRGATEQLIVATCGSTKGLLLDRGVPNVFIAPRTKHSKKPDEAFALVERLAPGPYLELFARTRRPNWEPWGLEVPPVDVPA